MKSPWAPQSLLTLSLSPSLSLRSLLWSFVCMVYPKEVSCTAIHIQSLTSCMVSFPDHPNFYYIIIDARKNVRSLNVESHRFNDCQVKNNPMRHEKSKDVDSISKKKACTTRSHILSSPEVRLPMLLLLSHLKLTARSSSLSLTVPTSGFDCRSHSLQESSSSFWTLSASQHW